MKNPNLEEYEFTYDNMVKRFDNSLNLIKSPRAKQAALLVIKELSNMPLDEVSNIYIFNQVLDRIARDNFLLDDDRSKLPKIFAEEIGENLFLFYRWEHLYDVKRLDKIIDKYHNGQKTLVNYIKAAIENEILNAMDKLRMFLYPWLENAKKFYDTGIMDRDQA